ncbi:protein of unknown function (plasmid) [Cupriavidus taiwanensis]|uniref:Uncharacterized protein n=1 Tax=Cupriavidus taiwanensis TaxID=164546 RepID=A0A375IPL1_9BURK|nr:protein of unknown function [Cupriavidus taiwanensis]
MVGPGKGAGLAGQESEQVPDCRGVRLDASLNPS